MLNRAYDDEHIEVMHKTLREVPHELEDVFWTILCKDNSNLHEIIFMLQ